MRARICAFFLILVAGVALGAQTKPKNQALQDTATLETRLSVFGTGGGALSYETERPFLSAPAAGLGAALSLRSGSWLIARASATAFWVASSGFDNQLFSYRAFDGGRFALETGFSLPLRDLRLEALAGAAISATEYSGTSLVAAFPSILAEARILFPLGSPLFPNARLELGLPLAYSWRSEAATIEAGLRLGVSVKLGRTARK
jgi:hypothetical protein